MLDQIHLWEFINRNNGSIAAYLSCQLDVRLISSLLQIEIEMLMTMQMFSTNYFRASDRLRNDREKLQILWSEQRGTIISISIVMKRPTLAYWKSEFSCFDAINKEKCGTKCLEYETNHYKTKPWVQ